MKDYYKTLEIDPGASQEVLNNAYRALVRKYHPDLYHSSDKTLMAKRMQAINEAYNVLSNAVSRADYDRRLRQAAPYAVDPPTRPVFGPAIRNMLLWGIGTYVVLRFLVRPLIGSPLLGALVLALAASLFFRYQLMSRFRK